MFHQLFGIMQEFVLGCFDRRAKGFMVGWSVKAYPPAPSIRPSVRHPYTHVHTHTRGWGNLCMRTLYRCTYLICFAFL